MGFVSQDQDPRQGGPELSERLARIEAHLADLKAALEAARPSPERDLDRAFRRFAVAVWCAGLLAIGAGSWVAGLEAWRDPRANVCAEEDAADYPECLRKPEAGSESSLLESLRGLVAGADVDRGRVVRRTETARHATSLRWLAGVAAGWTVAVFAAFGVLAWVARGLRPRR